MGGIGQGLANAGNAIGSIGVRDYEMREAARLRSVDREEDRAWREEQKELDRDRQDERDRMYRRTAEQQAAGSKGTGGMKGFAPEDIAPGGKLADMMAGQMGMTVPEYEQFYNARKTGNMSAFQQEREIGTVADDNYGPQPITEKYLPEGFKKEFAAKSKMLSDIQQSYVAGNEAKNIAEGRQIGLITNAAEGVLSGTGDVTRAYQAGGIVKGNDRFKEGGGVVVETATGTNKATPVGESQIAENKAQAGAQNKLAEKHGEEITKIREEVKKIQAEIPEVNARTKKIQAETGEVGKDKKGQTQERLSTVINSANATLKSLDDNGPGKTPESKALWQKQRDDAIALRDEAIALQKEALGARAAPPAATGTSTGGGAPKKVTEAEYKALPSGAKYIDPTGQIRTKK